MRTSLWSRPVLAMAIFSTFLLGGGLQTAVAHLAHVETEQIQLRAPHPDQATLDAAFANAAAQYKVPVELLRAVAFVESRWVHTGPTVDYGYGIMHLVNNSDATTLSEAAELTGLSVEDLKLDPIANINGGAALIAQYVKKTVGTAEAWLDYREALKRFSGLNESIQDKQALEYLNVVANGASGGNVLGMNIQLAAVNGLDLSGLRAEIASREVASDDYGPAIWNPAASCNYSGGRFGSNIDRWVNHWVGSGTYAGCISWFKNCNAETSAHFVVRQSDGEITQMVSIWNTGWHAGNWNYNTRSIGVEHEAIPSYSWPQYAGAPMIVNSAACCRHFCDTFGIPKTRSYILGHNQIVSTSCPGNLPWDIYMNAVNGASDPCAGSDHSDSTYESWPYDGDTVTCGQVFQKSWNIVNTGSATWTKACNFKWAYDGAQQGLGTEHTFGTPAWTDLGDNESIAPGQSKMWTLTFTAPSTPGLYEADYRMDRYGTARFGVTVWILVNVVAQNGNLTGTVTNAATSAPISGATVTLSGIGTTTTNGSGVYTFNSVAGGSYTVSVSATGYNPASDSVSIVAGNTTTKNFALTASDTQAPTTPTNLSATATAYNSVQLTWTASTDDVGVAGYDIRRNGAVIGSSATTSFTDNSVAEGTTYTYEVRARDSVPNYSGWSNAAQVTTPWSPPVSAVVFSDGFDGSLNNWTQGGSAYDYSTAISHGTFAGGGAAYVGATQADQMHHVFARPFAQGKVRGYFWDGKGGWQAGVCGWAYRQCLSLRDMDHAAKMYIDNEFYSASSNSNYFFRLVGSGGGTHTAYATRDAATDCNGAWVTFETEVTPAAGTFTVWVTDRAGTGSTTQSLTGDYFSWGFGRITLGLGVTSANEGYWDDISLEATPPGAPTMAAASILSDSQITWNFAAADSNHFGWDVMDAGGTVLSPSWPAAGWLDHNATSWTESGLAANTSYSRKVKNWNGTLDSHASNVVSATTLSVAPGSGSVTADNATLCSGDNVTWTAVGGFGAGKVAYYAYAWDTNPTYSFSGSEQVWNAGTLVLVPSTPGTWYLHIKGFNAVDVANGTYDYSVTATNCAPPSVTAAISRKVQGGSAFDIDVAVSSAVECRGGGPTQVIVSFSTAIEGQGGLDNSDVIVTGATVNGVSISGTDLTVTLSNAVNAGKLIMIFPGITAVGGATSSTGVVCFGVLAGDVSGDGTTNVFDLVAIRNSLNTAVSPTNFRSELTGDGTINVFDLVQARNSLNRTITGTCP